MIAIEALHLQFYPYLLGGALGALRLAPMFFLLPFLNSGVLSGAPRQAIIILTALSLWPHAPGLLPAFDAVLYLGLIARELTIGLALGCLLAWPFWAMHAMGSLIDNQRGATMSSSIDPVNGVDTSELSNLFNLFAAVIYLQAGGMTLMLQTVSESYRLFDPLQTAMPQWRTLLPVLNQVMAKAVVLASPVVAAMLLSEVLLGVLSRFAPQLNAFAVSMSIKSAIAFAVLLIYFGPSLPGQFFGLGIAPDALGNWLTRAVTGAGHGG
ncbi:SpaR/YscT/HrcT type III secretion system export apparatus protein [Oxalobacteraceae bacterium CAVE-383]|nr:SpaR/YscT/HrcT type III secretion system export apparatus protein [Oxalobacteraceae bacterium CAVE-383]